MSRGLNRCTFIGNLGQDPTIRYFPNGDAVCNVSIGVNESWKDRETGEKKERVEWVNLVFMKKLAEVVGQYLKKGSKVYVEGRMRTREWEKDGVKRYTTEIIVQDMQMLDGKPSGESAAPTRGASPPTARRQASAQPATHNEVPFEDDDIPFD
jgi:single-strand DNA-binding protein